MAEIKQPEKRDRSIWWTDLQYIAPEFKNELWAAEVIFFMKKNFKRFLDPKRAAIYRSTDRLELDEDIYKKMVDPVTPTGQGGTATYFNSDWKANPIYIHLMNIVKAEMQKSGKTLEVNCNDKFAKTRRQRDNYRVLESQHFRELLNEINKEVGLPQVTMSQDPHKWAQAFIEKGDKSKDEGIIDKYLELIKSQITDSQDMALYNEMLYKGDYEIGFEKAIQYYLNDLNRWEGRWSDDLQSDYMHFNKVCGLVYTNEVTGRPVFEGIAPEVLCTNPIKRKDGDDLEYYFMEYNVTFADFVKSMGRKLGAQELKNVFEHNKTQGAGHGMNWVQDDSGMYNRLRDNSMIRIGKAACLTQECSFDMDAVKSTYPGFGTNNVDWLKRPMEIEAAKHYNVWYTWYYIPPTTNTPSNADYEWQAQFIFDIKKVQDQQRYGDEGRYAKPPLVLYDNSTQASFTDIVQYWMPKIHHASHKFQNCLINDLDAIAIADDFIAGLVGAVDEENKVDTGNPNVGTGGNDKDAYIEQWRMIKQQGAGFLKMTDKNGTPILDPQKLVVALKNNGLEKAEKYLAMIALMYNEMVKSLARAPVTSGEEVKPRTPVAAIRESVSSSDDAVWFVQKGYGEFYKICGERIVQYVIECAKEAKEYKYTERWQEFCDVVGYANGLMLEGMEDVPPESVGMTVNYVDNSSKKDFVMELATYYVKQQVIDDDFVYLIMGIDNWKYAFVLLRMAVKKRKQELANEKQLAFQQQQALNQQQLQIAITLKGAETQGKDQNIMTQGKVQEMVNLSINEAKAQTMQQQKEQLKNNKLEENQQKADLNREGDTHKKNLEEQGSLIETGLSG